MNEKVKISEKWMLKKFKGYFRRNISEDEEFKANSMNQLINNIKKYYVGLCKYDIYYEKKKFKIKMGNIKNNSIKEFLSLVMSITTFIFGVIYTFTLSYLGRIEDRMVGKQIPLNNLLSELKDLITIVVRSGGILLIIVLLFFIIDRIVFDNSEKCFYELCLDILEEVEKFKKRENKKLKLK